MTDIARFADPIPFVFRPIRKDVRFAKFLVEKIGVAVVPGSSFYNNAHDGASQFVSRSARKKKPCRRRRALGQAPRLVGLL